MKLVKHDLRFILDQILIADAHTAGGDLLTLLGSNLLPYGLRTSTAATTTSHRARSNTPPPIGRCRPG